ncbi:MAG: hypothetical protein WDN49_05635 [Acetobacteraceae bacterium]
MRVLAENLLFPEGPVALADGSVLIVEIQRETVSRVWPDGRVEVVYRTGGGPNGLAIGPDQALYICNNGASCSGRLPASTARAPAHIPTIQRPHRAAGPGHPHADHALRPLRRA